MLNMISCTLIFTLHMLLLAFTQSRDQRHHLSKWTSNATGSQVASIQLASITERGVDIPNTPILISTRTITDEAAHGT